MKHEKAGKVWVGTSVSKMARKLWVCLVNEKERKVCLLGGRPYSGSAVQEGLASCMKRRARCVCLWVGDLGVGVRETYGLACCMKRRARCVSTGSAAAVTHASSRGSSPSVKVFAMLPTRPSLSTLLFLSFVVVVLSVSLSVPLFHVPACSRV